MKFDIWKNQYDIVDEVYSRDNYLIIENENIENNICYIFFSSNNIWSPNTDKAFLKSFIENNYFEWVNYGKEKVRKRIFLRDIYKSWYTTGISKEINSIDKILDFLKKETKGMKIVCVGSSAGGYMACLVGSLLKAERVFAFSCQFDIANNENYNKNPILEKYKNNIEQSKYFNITEYIGKSNNEIFYFLPIKSEIDKLQASKIKHLDCVNTIKFNSKRHGIPCFKCNLESILFMTQQELKVLNCNKTINPFLLSIQISGIKNTILYVIKTLTKQITNRVKR
ncbi:MAG: hypothetical protein R3Y35_09825 [Clostridia bacterium]